MQIVQVGRVLSNFLNQLIPGKRLAATVLVANPRTRKALPAGVKGKIVELVENGVDMALWQPKAQPKDSLPKHRSTTRFVFMGRLIDWKAADWLLLAFQQVVQQVPAELEIIGDGPSRQALEQLGAALKLTDSLHSTESGRTTGSKPPVRFAGWLSQADCARHLQQSDVLVLPSLFEAGGAAVLEAMAVGLPVIATNWGGPVDYVDASCGLLITPTSQAGFIQNLADAMIKLAQAPDLREQMGRNGRQRVLKYYDWEKKTDAILKIYADTVRQSMLTRSR
jgi:glycosyltransferase involved in cell wall biosynthesis